MVHSGKCEMEKLVIDAMNIRSITSIPAKLEETNWNQGTLRTSGPEFNVHVTGFEGHHLLIKDRSGSLGHARRRFKKELSREPRQRSSTVSWVFQEQIAWRQVHTARRLSTNYGASDGKQLQRFFLPPKWGKWTLTQFCKLYRFSYFFISFQHYRFLSRFMMYACTA